MGRRNFSEIAEATAPDWYDLVTSDHNWSPDGQPGEAGGIGAGRYVVAGQLRAFAKPTVPPKPEWGLLHKSNVIASHEKIASDLAYALGLAVPPALLWDRSSEQGIDVPFRCLSLVPFAPFYTWSQILAIPGMVRLIVPAITKEASEIVTFDTWLDNQDRLNSDNVILGMAPGSSLVRCAYIDFAQSMSFTWGDGPPPKVQRSAVRFPGAVPLDLEAVDDTIKAIESLSEDDIKRIVSRVPDVFISPARRSCIVDGLLLRRTTLRSVLIDGGSGSV